MARGIRFVLYSSQVARTDALTEEDCPPPGADAVPFKYT